MQRAMQRCCSDNSKQKGRGGIVAGHLHFVANGAAVHGKLGLLRTPSSIG